ncbi:unnamed protein product [Rotaria sordida]|uniref:Uncharacterized protein n=1 Tax=Rotaria sordida TaxID=392033 RepID=A0A814TJ04_9BILA|nr:unnamed protein product [Rotaria sordida]CAF4196643.1 unnamed protein product [Rotaria sordida]
MVWITIDPRLPLDRTRRVLLGTGLEHVPGRIWEGREMVADVQLQQRAIACPEISIEFSASFHLITQAQYGTMECNDNVTDADINSMIQYGSRQSLS